MFARTVLSAGALAIVLAEMAPAASGPSCIAGNMTLKDGKEQVLTLAETADFLRVAPGALKAAAKSGEVPGRLVLGNWRFSRAVLVVWMAGVDDPAKCFLTARVGSDALTTGEFAEVQGAGIGGSRRADGPPPSGSRAKAGGEEVFGEQPASETARDVALRGEDILLAAGEATLEPAIFYNVRNGDGIALVPIGGGFLPTESQSESRTVTGVLTGRYGLFDNVQLFAAGSLLYDDRKVTMQTGSSSLDQAEFGDVALGLRYGLMKEGAGRPSIILSGQAVVPTNGTNGYGVGGGVALIKSVDPVVLFASGNYLHTFSGEPNFAGEIQADDTIIMTAGYSFAVNDSLAIGSAVSGTFARFEDAAETWDALYSLRFSLTALLDNGLYIEPSVSFSLNGEDSQTVFGLTMPYSFVP